MSGCGARAMASARRLLSAMLALGLPLVFVLGESGLGQATPPLKFGNNYFVTGDYIVGGVGLRGSGINGWATGTIRIPDPNSVPNTGVPLGADIVAAFLYWETVESSQTPGAGMNGTFNGYAITGTPLGNPNAPVSWSSGGCAGSSQGSKTMQVYRADVRAYVKVDLNKNVLAGNAGTQQNPAQYKVVLADSGSNGGGAPLTLGASLVIIWRVLDKSVPLNAVIIYNGAYAPSNTSATMTQTMQGFYQATANPTAKLTHIVGNGQTNKYENVYLNSQTQALPTRYPGLPPFPGYYNGSWDNPTWTNQTGIGVDGTIVSANPLFTTTSVMPAATNSGCVSWGAVIFSTTVQNSQEDGILDVWKQNQGYCDAAVNEGSCSVGNLSDPAWVALPGAGAIPGYKDLFVQIDYMCSNVSNGACTGTSYAPNQQALTMMSNAFVNKNINFHYFLSNPIQEPVACTDTNTTLCPFPNQAGVVGWKGGFDFLKNQPLNYPDESSCEQALNGPCTRRFQHGRKDSYHYALFGVALGRPNWSMADGSLTKIVVTGTSATFYAAKSLTTSTPDGLAAMGDRVTIADAITNPGLNGTYLVTSATDTTFTIQLANATNATYTFFTDPSLSVASGYIGTGSGYSDVGGADSLITLGLWGADGQTVPVQAGTFMHELGHSLALSHGGYWFDTPGSYIPTVEANCKSNFQSVMNYLFQVDLLDNGALDYSEQQLSTLNESLAGVGVTTTNGSATAYATTKWYAPTPPNGVGTAATRYCDGTPLPTANPPTMYRLEGPTTAIAWSSDQDINFDGKIETITTTAPFTYGLRGYNDWDHIDLRQVGATGSLSVAGSPIAGGGSPIAGGGSPIAGGGSPIAGGGSPIAGGGSPIAGGGAGELTHEAANSVTRPPRKLVASVTSTLPRYIQLNWNPPTFGQIGSYDIYRSANGAPAVNIDSVSGTSLAYTDKTVTCGPTYRYFVTAVLGATAQQSVPSNTAPPPDQPPLTACAPQYIFTGFFSPLSPASDSSYSGTFNIGKSVTTKWTLQDTSGNYVGNLNANTLLAVGPFSPLPNGTCQPTQEPVVFNNPTPPSFSTLYSPTTGAKGNSTFRIATSNNQFIFNWDTTPFKAGCYVIELDLDSGQVERTALKLR